MDGYQALAKLKSHFKGARFFAISGRSGPEARQRSIDAGFEEHFEKPVDLNILNKRLSGGTIAFENRPPSVPGEKQDRNA